MQLEKVTCIDGFASRDEPLSGVDDAQRLGSSPFCLNAWHAQGVVDEASMDAQMKAMLQSPRGGVVL
jgi:hypothetical protein